MSQFWSMTNTLRHWNMNNRADLHLAIVIGCPSQTFVPLFQGKSAKVNKPIDANPDADAAAKVEAKPAAKSNVKSKPPAKSKSERAAKPSAKPAAAAKRNAKLYEKGAGKKRSASPRKTKAVDAIAATSSKTSESADKAESSMVGTGASASGTPSFPPSQHGLTELPQQLHDQLDWDASAVSASSASGSDALNSAASIDPPSTDAASGDVPDTRKKQRSKREAVVSRRAIKQQNDAAQPSISLPSYHELKANTPEQRLPLTAEGIQAIKRHIDAFRGSAHVQDQSLALYVNSKVRRAQALHAAKLLFCIDKLSVDAAQSAKCLQLHALHQSLLERQM